MEIKNIRKIEQTEEISKTNEHDKLLEDVKEKKGDNQEDFTPVFDNAMENERNKQEFIRKAEKKIEGKNKQDDDKQNGNQRK